MERSNFVLSTFGSCPIHPTLETVFDSANPQARLRTFSPRTKVPPSNEAEIISWSQLRFVHALGSTMTFFWVLLFPRTHGPRGGTRYMSLSNTFSWLSSFKSIIFKASSESKLNYMAQEYVYMLGIRWSNERHTRIQTEVSEMGLQLQKLSDDA